MSRSGKNIRLVLEPGDVLADRYEVGRPLALGGYAIVYEGTDLDDGGEVVIKCPRDDATRVDVAAMERFEREADAALRLRHPNLVRTLGYGRTTLGVPFIVMERLRGTTLAHVMFQEPMEAGRVRRLLVQMLRALGALHQLGLVHRDLKPSNVYLCDEADADGERDDLKLLDFGLVKPLTPSAGVGFERQLTKTGQPVGTPGYMAPELLRNAEVTPSVDLYAAGVIGYELLTGRQAFAGSNNERLAAQLYDEPELPPRTVTNQPLYAVVAKLMAKDPARRYSTVKEALAAVELSASHNTWSRKFRERWFGARR